MRSKEGHHDPENSPKCYPICANKNPNLVVITVHHCLDYTLMDYTLMDYSWLDYRHLDYLWRLDYRRLDYFGLQGRSDYKDIWTIAE